MFFLITDKCAFDQFLLTPDRQKNVASVIESCLAKAQSRYNVILYGFFFLSNHYHMLVRAPEDNLDQFMKFFKSQLALKLNRLFGRKGYFWKSKYKSQKVFEDALLDKLLYILLQSVKDGLTARADEWPGVSSLQLNLTEKPKKCIFESQTKKTRLLRSKSNRNKDKKLYQEIHFLRVTSLPVLDHLSCRTRTNKIRTLVIQEEDRIQLERRGKKVLGRQGIMQQNRDGRPEVVETTPEPYCHTKCLATWLSFRTWINNFTDTYKECSRRFRAGDFGIKFPPGSYRPPLFGCSVY